MPFNWSEFWQLADALGRDGAPGSKEAAGRSAVSRAYYAAFCHAREHAERCLKYERRRKYIAGQWGQGDDHGALPEHYRKRGREDIAKPLTRMRDWRNLCDYESSVDNLDHLVKQTLAQSKQLIERLTFKP